VADHAWTDAISLFQKADDGHTLTGHDLEKMAEAAFFAGQADLGIEAKERAFKEYLTAGDRARAGFMGIELWRENAFKGKASIGAAWLRRAARLLEDEPESFAHGHLAVARAEVARHTGDAATAEQLAEQAVQIGSKTGDSDLQAVALVTLGSVKISQGRVEDGFNTIEEAAVAAVNGELSPFVTGVTYCNVISVCRDLADFQRASEWTEATEKWCKRQSIAGFPGICRVHRAELVAMSGAWSQAEEELERATRELAAYNATPPMADGFYALAQLRFRRGDLVGAEEALRQAHELGKVPQPLLAQIALAQGNVRSAFGSIKSAKTEQEWDQWAQTRLLGAFVEIAVAAGELAEARQAAEEFTKLGVIFDSVGMQAEQAVAWGRVLIAEGDAATAIPHLRKAIEVWGRLGAPYEKAIARGLLGKALRALHDEDQADLELQAAHRDLVTLGAHPAAELVAAEIAAATARREGPVQMRKTFMFTDIVGSTNLAELLGDHAWDQLLRWHDESLRREFTRKGGEVVNSTGDGFFVAFDHARSAVESAIEIQKLLADHRRNTGFAPMVRIGLHTADANRHGNDYSGVGVHVAARVSALAGGGEIIVSADTVAEAGSLQVKDRRAVELKGVSAPVEVGLVEFD
jgi:class 3 adenylate cyclase